MDARIRDTRMNYIHISHIVVCANSFEAADVQDPRDVPSAATMMYNNPFQTFSRER